MYLIQYNELGKAVSIVPDPERGLNGTYINELPKPLEDLIESKSVEMATDENNKIYYKIGGNK